MFEQRKPPEAFEFLRAFPATIKAIGGKTVDIEGSLSVDEIKSRIEATILEEVRGLPEELAQRQGIGEVSAFLARAQELTQKLESEEDLQRRSELQVELVYQYIAAISQVQRTGDKAFTPALARELGEMECSLSAWSLKEKVLSSGVSDISFDFSYSPGHAAALLTVADGKKLYVDAQNGFVARVELNQVTDEQNPDTAYPIFEITASEILPGHLPDGREVTLTRPNGSSHMPQYLGISKDGTLHTVGNMHMLINQESPVLNTQVAKQFRATLGERPSEWATFEKMVEKIADGKVIEETRFAQ